MEYSFTMDESDYLTHQLFTVSQSKPAIRRRRRSWAITTGIFYLSALLFYQNSNIVLTYYFLFFGTLSLIFYPIYSRWRYKKHYQTHVREQFSTNFNKTNTVVFEKEHLWVRGSDNSESKISTSQIEKISDLPEHYLIKFNSGQSLILPKKKISDLAELKNDLTKLALNLHLQIENQSTWKWR